MHDLIIRRGLIVDGSGGEPFEADVALSGGRIAAVGQISERGTDEIDAGGRIVTPGFVDIHSHYDGQATWDDALAPSSGHGVTTVIMGNCGVGFAPVRPDLADRRALIELMEGVEDIPGTALWEGINWQWETFPQYLEFLAARHFAMDVGTLVPHGAVRAYVMGDRGIRHEAPTCADVATMSGIVGEAVAAGAFGVSTSRILGHQSIDGSPVPGTFADNDEIMAMGRAAGRCGGILQLIPGGSTGSGLIDLGLGDLQEATLRSEVDWMARLSREQNMQVTYLLTESMAEPDAWRRALEWTETENRHGAKLRPQVGARPVGLLLSLQGRHMFELRPTYMAMTDLDFAAKLEQLRQPEIKAQILAEEDVQRNSLYIMDQMTAGLGGMLAQTYPLGDPVCYTPSADRAITAIAARRGADPASIAYDLLLEDEGRGLLLIPMQNYVHGNEDALYDMLTHPAAVLGLADGGAHCSITCDGALPTYMLAHWADPNKSGPKLRLQDVVRMQTRTTAEFIGLNDRGLIRPGMRADLNVIDLDRLALHQPRMTYDLPAGGGRLLQNATGYAATIVNGIIVRRDDVDTGVRPGRLIRRGISA